jgi:iron uptake system component EfeO
MTGRGGLAVLGVAIVLAGCGDDDERGGVSVEGSRTGTGTGTTPVTVDTTASDPAQLDAAMGEIEEYAREQTGELVAATEDLQRAIDAGSVPRAKRAYAAARPYYERIEPLVALFPELDGKIDAREDDFPKKAKDPGWTGFHPIERMLWHDDRITGRTRRLAAGLVSDSKRLDELMRDAEVKPEVVIPGTAELVDEIEESKITGEEERYSKLDLPTFLANLEGSRAFYDALEPLVRDKDGGLNDQIGEAFDASFAEVRGLREGGAFLAYDDLDSDQQRAVKQRIEALAEPLARVQGTLGVRS